MRSLLFFVSVLLICLFLAQVQAQTQPKSINDFAWMAGCWENSRPAHKFFSTEQWTAPLGDGMLGMSRTVKGDKMTAFEFLRIVKVGDDFFYIAHAEDATLSAKEKKEKEERERKANPAKTKAGDKETDKDDDWETPFKLIAWGKNEATFENKEHDFPQRIIYKLTGPDALVATIEGEIRDRLQQTEYPMTRAKCQ